MDDLMGVAGTAAHQVVMIPAGMDLDYSFSGFVQRVDLNCSSVPEPAQS